MPAIRILHISSPLTWRGGEQQVAYLVKELANKNVEQWIISPVGSKLSEFCLQNNWNIIGYKKSGGIDLALARNISRIAKQNKIDIIHCHDAHAHAGAVLSAFVFGNKVPVVLSRRVDFPIGKSWFSRWKYNHRSIKAILCVSETIKKIITPSIHNKNIALKTVHSGIDIKSITVGKGGKLRTEFDIPSDTTIIANVAALADQKDYFTFIDTASVFEQEKDIVFVIIGDGPMRKEIMNYAKEKQVQNVIFTGFRNDMIELWPDIDLFLFTSKTEGLGTSLLDAMAHNIPVVSTNAGGIPEIISHNDSGYLADVADTEGLARGIRKVIADKEYKERIVAGAREKVQSFSTERTCDMTFDIYQMVLRQKM